MSDGSIEQKLGFTNCNNLALKLEIDVLFANAMCCHLSDVAEPPNLN